MAATLASKIHEAPTHGELPLATPYVDLGLRGAPQAGEEIDVARTRSAAAAIERYPEPQPDDSMWPAPMSRCWNAVLDPLAAAPVLAEHDGTIDAEPPQRLKHRVGHAGYVSYRHGAFSRHPHDGCLAIVLPDMVANAPELFTVVRLNVVLVVAAVVAAKSGLRGYV